MNSSTQVWHFRYRTVIVALRLPPDASGLMTFLRTYFEPLFDVIPEQEQSVVEAEIEVVRPLPTLAVPDFAQGNRITVDGSKGFLAMAGCPVDQQDGRWVALDPSGAMVHVPVGARTVRVIATPEMDIRIVVLRLIEDIALNAVQNSGGIVLHAAAVVADGAAVVAVGNKGAGKTSFLCEVLEAFAASMLCNDNACVFETDAGIVVRGWPSFFKASLGTVLSHDALADYVPVMADLDDVDAVWSTYEKTALYPNEAAEAFGTITTPEALLGQLLLPTFSREAPVGLKTVTPQAVKDELEACLQGIHNPNHPEWLGINPVDPQRVAAGFARFVDALARFHVPVTLVNWAPALPDLLRRIPALRRHDRLLNRARMPGRTPRESGMHD
jgi:hypothetical protein